MKFENNYLTVQHEKKYLDVVHKFTCGNVVLDKFIHDDILSLDNKIGITYLFLSEDGFEIIGYYNLSAGTLDYVDNGIRIKQCGTVHINYFAITQKYQGIVVKNNNEVNIKYSDILLDDCIRRIEEINEILGFGCITLSSTPQAVNLYSRFDFEEIDEDMCFSDTSEEKQSYDMVYFFDDIV